MNKSKGRNTFFYLFLLLLWLRPSTSIAAEYPCSTSETFHEYEVNHATNGYGTTPQSCVVGDKKPSEQAAASQCFNATPIIHSTLGPQPGNYQQGPAGVTFFAYRNGFTLNWHLSQLSSSPGSYNRVVNIQAICTARMYFVAPPKQPIPRIGDSGASCPSSCNGQDPVNPLSGGEYLPEDDIRAVSSNSPLSLSRYYNSINNAVDDMGAGWRHSYSRKLVLEYDNPLPIPPDPEHSSLYPTKAAACTTGWNQIKSRAVGLQSATAAYVGSSCVLTLADGSTRILPIYDDSQTYVQTPPTLIAVHATRDDGHVLNIAVTGSTFYPQPGSGVVVRAISGGYELVDESDNIETYDSAGRLLKIADRAGRTQTVSRAGPGGAISSVSDGLGHALNFGYDSSNRLHSVTGADGAVQYDYDSGGRLWKITAADGTSHQFLYQDPNWPDGISSRIDENGTTNLLWTYDGLGRVLTSKLGGLSAGMSFQYNANGTTTETSPLGATYTYAAQNIGGHMVSSSITGDPCASCGHNAATTYDSAGFPSSVTNLNGDVTRFSYDGLRGVQTSRTEAYMSTEARTITTAWHTTYRLPTQIEEYAGNTASGTALRTTTFTYDGAGNKLTETVSDGTKSRTTTYSNYTSRGQPQTVDGPRTDVLDVTALAYYPIVGGDSKSGQLKTITNALGHITTFGSYDGSGRPLQFTDPNGVTTTLAYDPRGRLRTVQVASQLTSIEYWPTGLVKKVTLPIGTALNYTYNAAHYLTTVTDQLGNQIVYTRDPAGNATKTQVFDSLGTLTQTHDRVYSTLNRLSQDIGAYSGETTTYSYDNEGNLKTITDPLLRQTVNTYDALSRLTQVTDPALKNTSFGLDAIDRLNSVTDPRSLITSYTVDALGNLSQTVSPDSGTSTQPSIDNAGNVTQRRDAKLQTTAFTYDALNRITQETRADSTQVVLTYDMNDSAHGAGIGRLTRMSDPAGVTDWKYDSNGNIVRKTVVSGGVALVVDYDYDASTGKLLSMTLPSGKLIGYTWTSGQISAVTIDGTNLVSNLKYRPFGSPKSWTFSNGQIVSRAFDLNGRMVSNSIDSLITYDSASRVTGWTLGNLSVLAGSHTVGYDALDRVTSFTAGGASNSYSYDANGNRSSRTVVGTSTTYTVSSTSNRVTQSTTGGTNTNYSFDANGSRTAQGSKVHTYGADGRLNSYTASGRTTTYLYNGLGERLSKNVGGDVSRYVYDEVGHLIGEYDGAGVQFRETVYIGDLPIGVIRGSTKFYVHADWRNAPRQLNNSAGQAVWAWDPNPFGENQPNQNPQGLSSSFTWYARYPGQYYDYESGLHYNYMRNYDPLLGRYLESDPVGLVAGVNTYAYVGSNPVNLIDPLGLEPVPPERPQPSVTAMIDSAIKRGDVRQLENLLEAAGQNEELLIQRGLQRLGSRASDIISKECRGSINREFPNELRESSLKEIMDAAKQGDSTARKALKLLNDSRFKK